MTYKICYTKTVKDLIVQYDHMKRYCFHPRGFVPPTNTPPALIQPPKELPSNSSPAKCHSCFFETSLTRTPTVGPVRMSSSVPIVQPSPQTTFASSPVANDNPLESSAFWRKKHFQIANLIPPCLILLMLLKFIKSPISSFTRAVSTTYFLDDPFLEQLTVVSRSQSGFPINFSTPTKTVTQRPLLTDALLNNASSRMATLFPIRRAEHNWPFLLRSNTVNQNHATAQHILNKQLRHELKN